MPTTFRPYSPDQSFLLPQSPCDWLPEGHFAYFIPETVDSLDLSEFYRPHEGDGRRSRSSDPRMLVKVLLYAHATGTFSSRRIARRIEEDVAHRVLAANNLTAHRTICEFRQLHLGAFGKLFVQVVRVVVGGKSLAAGQIELSLRRDPRTKLQVPVAEAPAKALELAASLR